MDIPPPIVSLKIRGYNFSPRCFFCFDMIRSDLKRRKPMSAANCAGCSKYIDNCHRCGKYGQPDVCIWCTPDMKQQPYHQGEFTLDVSKLSLNKKIDIMKIMHEHAGRSTYSESFCRTMALIQLMSGEYIDYFQGCALKIDPSSDTWNLNNYLDSASNRNQAIVSIELAAPCGTVVPTTYNQHTELIKRLFIKPYKESMLAQVQVLRTLWDALPPSDDTFDAECVEQILTSGEKIIILNTLFGKKFGVIILEDEWDASNWVRNYNKSFPFATRYDAGKQARRIIRDLEFLYYAKCDITKTSENNNIPPLWMDMRNASYLMKLRALRIMCGIPVEFIEGCDEFNGDVAKALKGDGKYIDSTMNIVLKIHTGDKYWDLRYWIVENEKRNPTILIKPCLIKLNKEGFGIQEVKPCYRLSNWEKVSTH